AQDLAKAGAFFLKTPVQSPGTHMQSGRDLLESWLSVAQTAGEVATNCVRCRFSPGQFLDYGHNLGFEDGLESSISPQQRDLESLTGENQFATFVSKLRSASKNAQVFRRRVRCSVRKPHLEWNPIHASSLS